MTVAHRDAQLCCLWIKALQGLHSVTFHHLCVLSWPPPFQASAEGGTQKQEVCFLWHLLFVAGSLFRWGRCHAKVSRGSRPCTILTLLLISLMENVTQCHFPHIFFFFFWYIGTAQVHVATHAASGRLHSLRESGRGGGSPCLPFSVQMCLCWCEPFRLPCPLKGLADLFCPLALWWETSCLF